MALAGISRYLNQNASILFTACGASQLGNKVPEALFKVMFGAAKNLTVYTNGSQTKLHDWKNKGKIKVRKNLNNKPTQWKPWTTTTTKGSAPLTNSRGNWLAPGLDLNGFMFFNTGTGSSTTTNGERKKKKQTHFRGEKGHGDY